MNHHPARHRQSAFTLVEIMIVCLIVGILSSMATFAIGRIKERTAQSLIANNLRQLYQAKEFYYLETGDTDEFVWGTELRKAGYLTPSTYERIYSYTADGLDKKMGWKYSKMLYANKPVQAYHGAKPAPDAPASKDIIYYPAVE